MNRSPLPRVIGIAALAVACSSAARALEIKQVPPPPALAPLPCHVGGRTVAAKAGHGRTVYRFQWPGVYFEAAFTGTSVYLEGGPGHAIFHVVLDGQAPVKWANPGLGTYRIDGLADAPHTIRVELATECQGGPVAFGGFALASEAKPGSTPRRTRQIEFIGDSHTVGYGNTSTTRQCTPDEIWSTTDTSRAFGVLVAKHYDADYQINAISGRGIVRNWDGGPGDTLPQAYPYALFDKHDRVAARGWDPQIVVIGLGTNDFSTALKPTEKWKSRGEEHADYERTYTEFLHEFRAQHPRAFFLLVASDASDGEIQAEVRKVVEKTTAAGERRVAFIPFGSLELTGCDWHPSLADHHKMASLLIDYIDRHPALWSTAAQ